MGEYVNGFLLNISQNKTLGENFQEILKILQKKCKKRNNVQQQKHKLDK